MRHAAMGATLFSILAGGCTPVGPDYARPDLPAPGRWAEDQGGGSDAVTESVAWWRTFRDPQLDSLIDAALHGNLDLAQAEARIRRARAQLGTAGAGLLPSVAAGGSISRAKDSGTAVESTSVASALAKAVFQAGFDASWEIDVFGGSRRGIEAAEARLQSSLEAQNAALLTLLGEVARNYVELRAGQQQRAIAVRNVEAQQQTLEVTRERYRLGLTAYADVVQAETQVIATQSVLPAYDNAIKQSIHRIGILLGREPNAVKAALSQEAPLPVAEDILAAGLPAMLVARRPDLRQAERDLAAASAEIGVAVADLYPKFDLTLGLGQQSTGPGKLAQAANRYWSIVPGVSLPAFDGGKGRAAVAGRRAAYDESLARYRSGFNLALEEVENALAAYHAGMRRREILVRSARSNEEAVAVTSERYRRGLTNFLDVLVAERSLYGAQSALAQSEAELLVSIISLYKALGGGWAA